VSEFRFHVFFSANPSRKFQDFVVQFYLRFLCIKIMDAVIKTIESDELVMQIC
jgi:hypothetical protein